MAGNKFGSEKQIQAVTSNLKEDQYLEKTMQTLSLEETYALKLLQLDSRIIKVNYRRLKERVTKIKSYLDADDIVEFKTLEQENKLKPLYSQVNLSGLGKIRAAAKRLKLQEPPKRRAQSANQKMLKRGNMNQRTITPLVEAGELKRPNSVTGVFMDQPEPQTAVRRLSLGDITGELVEVPAKTGLPKDRKNELNVENVQTRSKSADIPSKIPTGDDFSYRRSKKIRPATTLGVPARGKSQKRDSIFPTSKYAFSSHNLDADSSREKTTNETQFGVTPRSARRWSIGSGDSMDAFGPNPQEEMRKNFLDSEKETIEVLGVQQDKYLEDVKQFIKDGPAVEPNFINTADAIKGIDSCKVKPKYERKQDKSKIFISKLVLEKRLEELGLNIDSPTLPPEYIIRRQSAHLIGPLNKLLRFEDAPQEARVNNVAETELTPFQKQWNQAKKTRYLRSRDSQIDLTGVVTLARDQNKIARAWIDFTKKASPFKTGIDDDL